MPIKDADRQREASRELYRTRRDEWFAANGPCKRCGSWERLELDHIEEVGGDNKGVLRHRVFLRSRKVREAELMKCQALCHDCHAAKTAAFNRKREKGILGPKAMATYLLVRKWTQMVKGGWKHPQLSKCAEISILRAYSKQKRSLSKSKGS